MSWYFLNASGVAAAFENAVSNQAERRESSTGIFGAGPNELQSLEVRLPSGGALTGSRGFKQ